jgi:hypothetical protein
MKVETVFGDRCTATPAEVQGALWMKYGVSYVLDMVPSHNRRCHCVATEFKVDPFGRVYYTDQGRFRIVVLDTNGNEIMAFGQYGNQDDASAEGSPMPLFSWFTGLGVSDRNIYVADGSNRRVLRMKVTYGADETVAVE